jgi:hypothetical protein
MKCCINISAGFAALLLSFANCSGQGTITFDGPPIQPPGSAWTVQGYDESSMRFKPLPGADGFGRVWSNPPSFFPNNGTPYLNAAFGDALGFGYESGPSFSLVSADLAGYSTVVPDADFQFVGYRWDGTTVTADVMRHGINFQTYYFGPEWSGLSRVEMPNYGWSMDNLVFSVPGE